MIRPRFVHVSFSIGVLAAWLASASAATAQTSDPCHSLEAQQAWDSATSPVYAQAMALAQTLSSRGLKVECIRRSKEESFFNGQKGAAWYKTDQGTFEVWFLPESSTFSKLQVIEKIQADGRYVYAFGGTPRISRRIESSKPIVFIPDGSRLFEVWGDGALAKQLAAVVQKS